MEGGGPVKPDSNLWRLAAAGTELAGAVAGGSLLGYWIDRQLETSPWGLLIGASVGIVGGLYNLVRKAVHESLRIASRTDRQLKHKPAEGEHPGGPPPKDGGNAE